MTASKVVNEEIRKYYENLPDDILPTIGKSFLYTFTACMIACNRKVFSYQTTWTVSRPLGAAFIAATASLIHALATPLFNRIFGDRASAVHREFIKACFVITSMYILVNHLVALKTHVFTLNIFGLIPISLIKSVLLLPAIFIDWVGNLVGADHAGNPYRSLCEYFGLTIRGDSNSVYFMFV